MAPDQQNLSHEPPLPNILRIPLEIRNMIYGLLIPQEISRGIKHGEAQRKFDHPLLYTNRQLREEAHAIVCERQKLWIDLTLDKYIRSFHRWAERVGESCLSTIRKVEIWAWLDVTHVTKVSRLTHLVIEITLVPRRSSSITLPFRHH